MTKQKLALSFVLILACVAAACAPASATTQNAEGEHWVAFSAENARKDEMAGWLFPGDPEYWSPTEADIRALESGLPAFLQDNKSAFYMTETLVWERLDEYNRQYIGLVLNGQQVIYTNYFCNSSPNWKQTMVFTADGGACYFQFKFDTSTDTYFDLQVNGEA